MSAEPVDPWTGKPTPVDGDDPRAAFDPYDDPWTLCGGDRPDIDGDDE